jgi:hypothetical protein
LYLVRSYMLSELIASNFEIKSSSQDDKRHQIKQQDNPLFRLVRIISGNISKYNPYVIFVDSAGSSKKEEDVRHLVFDGVKINGQRYVFSERSASMTRNGIFSLVDESIECELNRRITMDISFEKTVLSKYYAYRGLFFSSCHCLEGWRPKIIVVPDRFVTIPNQHIKHLVDVEVPFTDDAGNQRIWQQKDVVEDTRDIEINAFDGHGIHHPSITDEVTSMLGATSPVTSILWRAPYIKGVTDAVDYESFFMEHGVDFIQDIWGCWHSVHDKMIIITEGMYKGFKYFKKYGDARDWDRYWDLFDKYDHCIGVAKWNFSFDEEPVYTRSNYQILQDLDLPYEDFRTLADESIEWADKIVDGDPLHTYAYLGLFADRCTPVNGYARSVLKNPEMLKERGVRKYLRESVKKHIDDMKCGKLWMRSCFKFLVPDIIMLMEHIGGLPLVGSLEYNEFYSRDASGQLSGEYLIERNPHICKSEHAILTAVSNPQIEKYVGRLANICMVNCKSLIAQRLNGADMDGDLVLVLKNELMMSGVDRRAPIVIDTEDKITAIVEEDTPKNRLALMMRTMHSLIGEYSNYSSAYHNKCPRTPEQKAVYEKYVDQISVLTGKAIDLAKTGVFYKMPRHIAKFGRPLPYFMKYRKAYYQNIKLSKSPSNMNRLCRDIEHWHKTVRWKRVADFDWRIMTDESIVVPDDVFDSIRQLFLEFNREMSTLVAEQRRVREYSDEDIRKQVMRADAKNYVVNWNYYYQRYRDMSHIICPDQRMLANIAVRLQYELYPKSESKFMWIVAENGILENIKQVDGLVLPIKENDGVHEYLGRTYVMLPVAETCNEDVNGEILFD